jgi:mersacidin/lichenicidin family type 2 lantibiotic
MKGKSDMKFDIVRAWKDASYRHSLSEEELALLPSNPAGEIELTDADLETVNGAACGPVRYTETHGPAFISAVRTLLCVNSSVIEGTCTSYSVEAGCNSTQANDELGKIEL